MIISKIFWLHIISRYFWYLWNSGNEVSLFSIYFYDGSNDRLRRCTYWNSKACPTTLPPHHQRLKLSVVSEFHGQIFILSALARLLGSWIYFTRTHHIIYNMCIIYNTCITTEGFINTELFSWNAWKKLKNLGLMTIWVTWYISLPGMSEAGWHASFLLLADTVT